MDYTGFVKLCQAVVSERVRFIFGAGFYSTQAVVSLSLSKGDGSPKESSFAL